MTYLFILPVSLAFTIEFSFNVLGLDVYRPEWQLLQYILDDIRGWYHLSFSSRISLAHPYRDFIRG